MKLRRLFLLTILLLMLAACRQTDSAENRPLTMPTATIAVPAETIAESVSDAVDQESSGQSETTDRSSTAASGNAMSGNSMDSAMMAPATSSGQTSSSAIEAALMSVKRGTLEDDEYAAALALAHPVVVDVLSRFDGYSAESWFSDDDGMWHVELYQAGEYGDWIGWALVDIENQTVIDVDVPRFLSDTDYLAEEQRVLSAVINDGEVQAWLGNADAWEAYAYYDEYDGNWSVTYYNGLDSVRATVSTYEDQVSVFEVYDPERLEAAEAQAWDREQAIELALSVEDLWTRLDGVGEWRTIAEPVTGSQWDVTIIGDEASHYYARVDIDTWEILAFE